MVLCCCLVGFVVVVGFVVDVNVVVVVGFVVDV